MIVYIVLGIVVLFVLVKLLTKYVPIKYSPIIAIALLLLSVYLGWQLYGSIIGPVEFNKKKEVRYQKVIAKLKDIKAAQEAHQEITGDFSDKFENLVRFIDTAQYALTSRRDSSYADVEKNKAYGIDEGYFIDVIVTDTLGYRGVKDSLFGNSDRYKTMMNVPDSDVKFDLKAGKLDKNNTIYSVFEAKVAKEVVLQGLNKDLINQEKQTNSVEGVRGAFIRVGSMDEVDTSGNWSKKYDSGKKNN